ncbi:Fe-S-oxidoreductase [Paludibacter sp. 221]|uniref:Fe-S-oxidoreductase n=1 Tax=Paludibacter sp. 221 TaxID=2302939 RepID=UPI0013D604F3|nr:Fe-S-oxidoreductase [Paludibacter sp. 221]NDV46282.1 Fe-S-oxidoreductase [Paludibacter sp. 221]
MSTLKNIAVPTGNILITKGEKGLLECLSIGDYGKEANIKADFLGLTNEINGVEAKEIMPLTEKWVITISTQYGCSMGCKFCDVPKVGKGRNATLLDLNVQIIEALKLHPEIQSTKRLNVHYARMGEPTFNHDVLNHALRLKSLVRPYIGRSLVHPVVSTMLPKKNKNLIYFLQEWCEIKNYNYRGDAGLQFSINSTDDNQREYLFSGNSLSLKEISEIGKLLPDPIGRKYALNFALANDSIIDADVLRKLFSPKKFMCKITPIHETFTSNQHGITTSSGYEKYYPYKQTEEELKAQGFDVLVFIPSKDEDESRITCGNAILSDK